MSRGPLVRLLLRLAIGGLFLYAGVVKILDPVGLAGTIAAYRLLPYGAVHPLAATLPWLEACCGLLLVAGIRRRPALYLLLMLDLVFIVALGSAIARGLEIDCGCFRSGGPAESPWLALGRDLLILAGVVVLLMDRVTRRDGLHPRKVSA